MRPLRPALVRLFAAFLLWAPILLWLTAWVPPRDGLTAHVLTATLLSLIVASALRNLFVVPAAAPGPGRYRVLPTSPHRPLLIASLGTSSAAWGAWRLSVEGADALGLCALSSGAVALWSAARWRADPLWGTWLEVAGEVLRVHCPRAGDWSVPLAQAIAVHHRVVDDSFLLETPWPERDVFVPSPRARARYLVTDHQSLFRALSERVPVRETPLLLSVLRRRRDRRES